MSDTLDRVREKYPQYKDTPDDELALRIGTKYPAYLERDPGFKEQFQGVVAERSIKVATKGTGDLVKVLSNPALGEAAEAGREQSAFQRATDSVQAPPRDALERAARNFQEAGPAAFGKDYTREPIDIGGTKIMPTEGLQFPNVQPPPEAGTTEKVAAGLYNVGVSIPNFALSPEGIATMIAPEVLPAKLIGPLLKGIFAGLMAKSTGEQLGKASVTHDPQDVTEGLASLVMAGGIASHGALETINERRKTLGLDPVSKPMAGLVTTLMKRLKPANQDAPLSMAAEQAKEVAPMTAAAVQAQPEILSIDKPLRIVQGKPETGKDKVQFKQEGTEDLSTREFLPKTAQAEVEATKTPTEPEKPQAEAKVAPVEPETEPTEDLQAQMDAEIGQDETGTKETAPEQPATEAAAPATAPEKPAEPEKKKLTPEEARAKIKADLEAFRVKRDAHVSENLKAAGEGDSGVEMRENDRPDVRILITKEPTDPSKWRATRVDEHGPSGHQVFDSRDAAIRAYSGEAHTEKVAGPSYASVGQYSVSKVVEPEKSSPKAEPEKVEPPKPKVKPRPLTKPEQEEFQDLSIKARRAREQGGEQLTTEETQRYEHLTALAGQMDLLGEDANSGIRSRIKQLREKIGEMDRLRIRTQERAFESRHRREELIKEARTYDEAANKAREEARELEQKLPEYQEEQDRRRAERQQVREAEAAARANGEDLFNAWPKPLTAEPELPTSQTKAEFKESNPKLPDADKFHEAAVRAAVDNDQPVDPQVLEEYPDLKPKETPPTQESTHVGVTTPEQGAVQPDGSIANPDHPADAPAAKEQPKIDPNQKYRIGTSPQTYTLIERLDSTEVERENGEQPVRVRNEKTGVQEIVMEDQLHPVRSLTDEEKAAGKGPSKKQLDAQLQKLGLDPSEFKSAREKKAAIKRERQKMEGPGSPSASQGPDPKAQIQQLEESFRNIDGKKLTLQQKADQIWDDSKKRFESGKDGVSRAITGLKNAGDYLIHVAKGYGMVDDIRRLKGDLSADIETRGRLARKFAKTVLKEMPNKAERAAIRKWVDAGGDDLWLIQGENEAPAQYKQAYRDARNLSPDALVAAQNIRNYFESRLQEAIDAGVLEQGVADYIHRVYERDSKAGKAVAAYVQSSLLKTNPRMAMRRVFSMDWEAERLGYRVVQDFVPSITAYETSLSKAIASREFVKATNKLKAPDGRPVVAVKGLGIPITDPAGVREGTLIRPHSNPKISNEAFIPDPAHPGQEIPNPAFRGDYVERPEYGALRKWKWLGKDSDGKPMFMQGDVSIHPDYVDKFDNLLAPSRIRYARNPKLRAVAKVALGGSSIVKQTMLDFSGFHQVQIGVHAAEHRVYTLPGEVPKALKALGFEKVMQDIDLSDEVNQKLLKGGVTIGGDYFEHSSEGLVGNSVSRLIPGVSELMQTYHSYLFQDFIPRVKMTMARSALARNLDVYKKEIASGKMSEEDIYHLTANQANAAFGELNYNMMERSKTMQDLARIILLAPDFLEARAKFAGQALFTKHGAEQRMALFLGAATMWTVARITNQLIDGQPHLERENLFSVVYKGKAYGLRTVQGDILHLIDKPVQFWMSRLNPIFGRTLLEMATGRDYFGRKRSALEQLWDGVSTAFPISLRTSRERSLAESLMNGMGITARRWNDVDDAFKLAQKWKDKNGVGMKGEFIYDANKDPLRPLKIALSNGDERGSTKEIKALIDSKKMSVGKLNEYFNHYSTMPFTGSGANDKKFFETLNDDQKKTVESAKQHKQAIRKLYQQARDKYQSAIKAPSDDPEPEPEGQNIP
jgi:hypothetical protein